MQIGFLELQTKQKILISEFISKNVHTTYVLYTLNEPLEK